MIDLRHLLFVVPVLALAVMIWGVWRTSERMHRGVDNLRALADETARKAREAGNDNDKA